MHAVIGVHAYEQSIKQPLWVTISFSIDAEKAAVEDTLSSTVDYAAVCESVQVFVDKTPCRLLETFVAKLAYHLKEKFSLAEVKLNVIKKPKDLPYIDGISIHYVTPALVKF